jgi:hypothetical protein
MMAICELDTAMDTAHVIQILESESLYIVYSCRMLDMAFNSSMKALIPAYSLDKDSEDDYERTYGYKRRHRVRGGIGGFFKSIGYFIVGQSANIYLYLK